MAVDARHLNVFPQQDRNEQQMRFPGIPFPTRLPENHCQQAFCDSMKGKTSLNTDSGLTHNNIPAPRKRSRDSDHQFYAAHNFPAAGNNTTVSQYPSSVTETILPQIQQYELEIDAVISQHTKRIRLELQERQKQQTKLLVATIGEGIAKKLREKDEQIQRITKLNLVLQERVKSLYIENQLWRDLAQTNEATVNSLRTNLEQALQAQVGGVERISAGFIGGATVEEDVQSCCGSSDHGRDIETGTTPYRDQSFYSDRRCRRCGERESCVLLLPCRHLCLCNVCGGSGCHLIQTCPVCDSTMNATLHVNM